MQYKLQLVVSDGTRYKIFSCLFLLLNKAWTKLHRSLWKTVGSKYGTIIQILEWSVLGLK